MEIHEENNAGPISLACFEQAKIGIAVIRNFSPDFPKNSFVYFVK